MWTIDALHRFAYNITPNPDPGTTRWHEPIGLAYTVRLVWSVSDGAVPERLY